jgi:hypothetical protein
VFEGKLYAPGASVPVEKLGERGVALEFAGPQGTWKRRREREDLWILWRYDWEARDWREIARAFGAASSLVLRPAAIRAMRPAAAETENTVRRGNDVADSLLHEIDDALVLELPAVRAHVLSSIYNGMAGRIVA